MNTIGDQDGICRDCNRPTFIGLSHECYQRHGIEDQYSITNWADQTFGPVTDPLDAVIRVEDEIHEFDSAKGKHQLLVEAADIVITLYRLASVYGVDLHSQIDRKMAINRSRRWKLDGTGHGQHLPDDSHK